MRPALAVVVKFHVIIKVSINTLFVDIYFIFFIETVLNLRATFYVINSTPRTIVAWVLCSSTSFLNDIVIFFCVYIQSKMPKCDNIFKKKIL